MKRMLALTILALFLFGLTACGKAQQGDVHIAGLATTAASQAGSGNDELTYVAVYGSAPDWMRGVSNASAGNGRFWQVTSQWELGDNTYFIASVDAAGGFFERHPYVFQKDHFPNGIAPIPGEKDGLWFVESVSSYSDYAGLTYEAHYVVRIDADGKVIAREDITRLVNEDTLHFITGIADNAGRYCVYLDENLCLFDADGTLLLNVETDPCNNYPELALTADGHIALMLQVNTVSTLYLLDENASQLQSLGPMNVAFTEMHLVPGDEFHDLYLFDKILYGFDMETGEKTQILRFADVDINENDLVRIIPNGVSDTGAPKFGCYEIYGSKASPISLEQRAAGIKKEVITLAVTTLDYRLQEQIIDFNRRSLDYRIDYTEYATAEDPGGLTGLSVAMATGDLPDMIVLDNTPEYSYIRKGLLLDLTPFMEADEELTPGSFLPNILEMLKSSDGAIYALTPGMRAETMYTLKSAVGDLSSWNFSDVNAILDANPAFTQPIAGATDVYGAQRFLNDLIGQYVDWDNLTCDFTNPEFLAFLDFARRFPPAGSLSEDVESVEYFAEGDALMFNDFMVDMMSFMDMRSRFGDDLQATGFPGSGTIVNLPGRVAITAGCGNSEAAWSFMHDYMLSVQGEDVLANVPVLKAEYEDYVDYWRNYYITHADTIANGKPLYQPTESDYAAWDAMMEAAVNPLRYDTDVFTILNEELTAYLEGKRSAAETADIIQSRVSLKLAEMG